MALTLKQKLIKILIPILFPFPFLKIDWKIFKPKTNGVKIVVENNGEFLFIKNSYGYKKWTFPGGGINYKETPIEAAQRELKEETGIDDSDVKLVDKIIPNSEGKIDTIYIFYTKSNTRNTTLCELEIKEGRWFALKSLPEVSPITKKILDITHNTLTRH